MITNRRNILKCLTAAVATALVSGPRGAWKFLNKDQPIVFDPDKGTEVYVNESDFDDGSYTYYGVYIIAPLLVPIVRDLLAGPFLVTMPCGTPHVFPEGVPSYSVPCSCGSDRHWPVFWEDLG